MTEKKQQGLSTLGQVQRGGKNSGAGLRIGRNDRYRADDLADWLRSLNGDAKPR